VVSKCPKREKRAADVTKLRFVAWPTEEAARPYLKDRRGRCECSLLDRRDGFLNRIKDKYPNIKIVSVQYGGGDHLKSAEIAKAMIQVTRISRASAVTTAGRCGIVGIVRRASRLSRTILIYGATGYTGKLIANVAVDQGALPILAGKALRSCPALASTSCRATALPPI
jgi:hypothetical protein